MQLRLLRRMTPADIVAAAEIEASVQEFPWTSKQFADSLRDGHLGWVIGEGNRVVAFAVVMQVLDEVSLLTIGVCKEHQRHGLGRQLIDTIVQHAGETGAAVLLLEVRKSNLAARSLYRRMGMVETGLRKGYYRTATGREDAILMALTLDEGGR